MNENTGGRFRHKRANFSMVSNEILRDDEISLKAKGLYSIIQSYITLDNFILYKGFLMAKCPEGRRAFDGAWNELKAKGYLVQYRMKDEQNRFYYEYELLDSPMLQNVTTGISGVSFCDSSKCADSKRVNINNTDSSNTLQNNTESIISINDVKRQIGAGAYKNTSDSDIVENVATLIHEVLTMPDNATLRINGNTTSARNVKPRFEQIKFEHLDYILLALKDYTGSIGNYRNYMLTVLFNSVGTVGIYFQNRVNHDFYN